MKQSGRKSLALLLAVCLLLGLLAGCGKKDDTQQLSATVYVPKYLDLSVDMDYVSGGCSDGEYVYMIGEKNEEIEQSVTHDGIEDKYTYYRSTYDIYRVSLDGTGEAEKLANYEGPTVPEGKDGSSSVNQIAVGKDGTLWVTERVYIWGDMYYGGYDDGIVTGPEGVIVDTAIARAESAEAEPAEEESADDSDEEEPAEDDAGDADVGDIDIPVDEPVYRDESYETVVRRQLDKDGNEISRFDMSNLNESLADVLGEDEYINSQSFDSEGNLYVCTQSKIYAMNSDMSVRFTVEGEDMWYEPTPLAGGLMGMQQWDYDEETETSTHKLRTIDPEKEDWGTEYILPSNAYEFFTGGGDYLFYYQASDSVYGFRAGEPDEDGMGTGKGERLFSWLEADINSDNVRSFFFLPDGRVAAILQEWDTDYENTTISVITMTATPRSELPEKTTLVYATLYLNYDARNRILDFNKKNDKYRIEVRDYSEYMDDDPTGNAALQKMNTEILAGRVPDILDTNSIPVRQYGAKGILEDLWPFIDNDPDLGRENLMVRPLEANQQDGKLYEIFSTFSMRTAAGPASIVGDRYSWTLADLRESLGKMPEGCSIFGIYDTKTDMLNTVVSLNLDRFVDWKTGVCSFDSDEFKALLEFCDSFPAEFDYESVDEWEEEEARAMTGKQLLIESYIGNFNWNLQRLSAVFNGEYTFVGYPKEDGSCGSSFNISRGVAMTGACKDKEGAWSFIRQTLLPRSEENGRYYYYGNFPINKGDFDQMVETTLNNRYETDIDGNPLLDEEGNPIPIDYGTMWLSDDLQIKLEAVTQDDVDKVMALYNAIDTVYRYDEKILDSVQEVAGQYFAGDKPLDEAASLIQNKVKLYVGENM